MSQERWSAVDDWTAAMLGGDDAALAAAAEASARAELPAIAVTPNQGKLLHLIARIQGARTILEMGTLGGYSTIWLARALPPDGRLVTLELEPRYAEVARANLERAGVAELVQLRAGPALESLRALIAEKAGPFDLIFIDADKQGTPEYFSAALELSRAGTVIVTDNVVRAGAIVDAGSGDERVEGMRRFHELLAGEPRASATTIQTVGGKGYDGFTLALVEGEP